MDRRAHQPAGPQRDFPTFRVGEEHAGQTNPASVVKRRQPIVSSTFRLLHQLPPWILLVVLPVIALFIYLLPWPPTFAKMLTEIALGGLTAWWQYSRRVSWAHRAYALTCVIGITLWLLYATRVGLWSGLGRFSLLLLILGWLYPAWIWWDYHRVRSQADNALDRTDEDIDPFIAKWNDKVQPKLKWTLSGPRDLDSGRAYRIQLVPGETIEDAEQAKRKVASLLRIARARITFDPRDGDIPGMVDDESVITMIITPKIDRQLTEPQTWEGATLDVATGLYRHGVYPDGPAFLRLFRTEDGHPNRACNSLITGSTGSGKSRGSAIKIAEQVMSGMFVTWYADGKGGASAPELEHAVDWYADSLDETIKMARAAWRVMKVRTKTIKRLQQEAFRGRRVIFLGSTEFPFLQLVLDEAQEFLKHPVTARLVKALLRMGNQVAMGVDLLTQVPLLIELGGASGDGGAEVIRAMAKSGNVAVYRADENFTGQVTLTRELAVNPNDLPRVPGSCYLAGHTGSAARCRTYYLQEKELFQRLSQAPVVTLEPASARAAGEDYATRHQRAQEADVAPEEMDLDDLDTELAVLLGERLPGQVAPGQAANKLTIKSAVFEIVKASDGPIKRDQITVDLAARGVEASKSAIDQALRWWCELSHMHQPVHAHYDLINREGATAASDAPAGASSV